MRLHGGGGQLLDRAGEGADSAAPAPALAQRPRSSEQSAKLYGLFPPIGTFMQWFLIVSGYFQDPVAAVV